MPLLKKVDRSLSDWRTLRDRATLLLRGADQAPPRENLRGMALQLRLWRYPTGGKCVSWSVLVPVRDYRARLPIVREASWDPAREPKRGACIDPEIRIRDIEIEAADLAPFLKTAGGFQPHMMGAVAPAAPGRSIAGIEGGRDLSHVRLEWSGRGPRAFAATIAWCERFRRLLADAFRPS
jgi:hypothetical protein